MKYPTEAEWWRLNRKEDSTYDIEWTSDIIEYNGNLMNGAVRARVDSITAWDYHSCSNAKYALSYGENIINNQKKLKRHLRY